MTARSAACRRVATPWWLAALLCGCACLGSCSRPFDSTSPDAAEREYAITQTVVRNQRFVDEIARKLTVRRDVAAASLTYRPADPTEPESVIGEITVTAGADVRAVVAEFDRLVWTSRVNPMSSFKARIYEGERLLGTSGPSRSIEEELTRKWGPRPT